MKPVRQKYIGEVGDRIGEIELEQAAHFFGSDFALELRGRHRAVRPAPVYSAWHFEITPAAYTLELFAVANPVIS